MRTPTDKKRLPDPEGWDDVQDWAEDPQMLRNDTEDDTEPDTERLLIFGESGTGKTRAMKDAIDHIARYDRKKAQQPEYIRAPVWSAEDVNRWMSLKPDGYVDCAPLSCFTEVVEDLDAWGLWLGKKWESLKTCSNCPCLKYLPSKGQTIGIDDMQNFTGKKHLQILRAVFEYWPKVVVTVQTPEGMPPGQIRQWLTKQLAGGVGANQTEAEAVIRRLFEPGICLVHMQRGAAHPPDEEDEIITDPNYTPPGR